MYVGESEVGCVNVGRSVAFHPVGVGEVANNTVAFHPVGVGEVANNTVASHPVGLGEVADNTVASYPVGLEACSNEGPVVEVYVASAASGVSSKDPASTQHGGVFGFRHGRDALPTDGAPYSFRAGSREGSHGVSGSKGASHGVSGSRGDPYGVTN